MFRVALGMTVVLGFLYCGFAFSAPMFNPRNAPSKVEGPLVSLGANEVRTSSTSKDGVESFHLDLPTSPSKPASTVPFTHCASNENLKAALAEARRVKPGTVLLIQPAFYVTPQEPTLVSKPSVMDTPTTFVSF